MRRIPVDAVTDGMVLARAVEDRLGRVLLIKGDTLQARYRDKLRDWGITEVAVEGEADPGQDLAQLRGPAADQPADTQAAADAAAKVERRFAGFDEQKHPVMAGLKLLALKHLSTPPAKS